MGETAARTNGTIGFWAGVWKLVLLRARIEVVEFAHTKVSYKVANTASYLFILMLVSGVTLASWAVLWVLRANSAGADQGLMETPGFLLTLALGAALPSALPLLMQELFQSKDLPFLLVRPLPVRSVLAAKILFAAMPGGAMFGLFYYPYLGALGNVYAFSPAYYLALPLPSLAIAMAATALCSLVVLTAARFFTLRAIWITLAVVFIAGMTAVVLLMPSSPHNLRVWFDPDTYSRLLRVSHAADLPFSPLALAGRGLVALGTGDWPRGAALLSPLLLLCAAVFSLSVRAGERIYLDGVNAQTRRRSSGRRSALLGRTGSWLAGLLPRLARPIVIKDLRFFTRDAQYMTILTMPLLMAGLLVLSLLRQRTAAAEIEREVVELPLRLELFLSLLSTFMPALMTYMISTVFGTYIVFPLISLEGRAFWILRSSPVRPADFLTAKYCVALLIMLPMYAAFTLTVQLILGGVFARADIAMYTHLSQALTLAAMAALYLAAGAAQARFDWLHPGKLMNVTALLYSLGGSIMVGAAGLLFYILPAVLYAYTESILLGLPAGLLCGGGVCYLFIRWQLGRARKRVDALLKGE